MSQNTLVFQLSPARAEPLRRRLGDAGYEERRLAHAFFQARGEGVTVSFYRSGKVVVQGKGAEGFALRHLDGATPKAAKTKKEKTSPSSTLAGFSKQTHLGSDEAGKGDSFGGLTVAAVVVESEQLAELAEAGVTDSKALTDQRVRVLAPWLRERYPYAERVLAPAEYNAAHAASGANVNTLLARLHQEVLQELAPQFSGESVYVDRFSPREPVRAGLEKSQESWQVTELPRAERIPAVAAASVLARESFLVQMEELREAWAVDLPLGSGAPVPPAMRRFLAVHGPSQAGQVAKLHFSNVQRLLEGA